MGQGPFPCPTLTWDNLQGEGVVIGAAREGETTSYTYGLERISAITDKTRTEYVYDGRGSVAAEVSYNDSWYSFGGALAKKDVTTKSCTPFGEQIGEAEIQTKKERTACPTFFFVAAYFFGLSISPKYAARAFSSSWKILHSASMFSCV